MSTCVRHHKYAISIAVRARCRHQPEPEGPAAGLESWRTLCGHSMEQTPMLTCVRTGSDGRP
eukprot:4437100-Prymnesium_polylepis.1